MATIELGSKLPKVTFQLTDGINLNREEMLGKNWLIYFYPKDNTPGCTLEGKNFRDHYKTFQDSNTEIIGISRDSLEKHEKFKCKYEFPFPLASDESGTICQMFDVLKDKKMFGKSFLGIERSSFLLDKDLIVRAVWRKVKVSNHVDEVMHAVRDLEK